MRQKKEGGKERSLYEVSYHCGEQEPGPSGASKGQFRPFTAELSHQRAREREDLYTMGFTHWLRDTLSEGNEFLGPWSLLNGV